ncbi:hypothetical protein FES32_003231 [Escherichia coli]|nr:hypothetical protein [Escherichia coli]EET7254166.1 hypothetical protein [Escherichia coli]EFJ0451346.1 hypothetical protein [Escherichia coli]HBA7955004.1 hypothetical protein [Escherichia coli]HBA7977694.1 hypothetical protein [Escherichia coli]
MKHEDLIVRPLADVQDLMRRGLEDPIARSEARDAIIAAVDFLLERPEYAHVLMRMCMEAHQSYRHQRNTGIDD